MNHRKFFIYIVLSSLILIAVAMLSMSVGIYKIKIFDLLKIFVNFLSGNPEASPEATVIFKIRLPRILLAAITGASLSLSGLVFQSVLRNPLADPYLLGVSSGSALGVVIFSLLTPASIIVFGAPVAAFTGGMLSVIIVFYLIPGLLFKNRISLSSDIFILSGVIVSFLAGSIIIFLISFSEDSHLQKIFFWLMGSFSLASKHKIFSSLPFLMIILPLVFVHGKALNLIQLDDESAISLGINPFRIKKRLLALVSMLTSSVVAVSGTIGFVGLLIPHLIKLLFGFDNRINIWLAPLIGATFLIIADTIARTLSFNVEIPAGAVTTIIGAPAFIYILTKRRENN